MAPVIPPPASEAPAAAATPTAEVPAPAPGAALVATPSTNPLRKQTLLGIAPVLAREPAAAEAAAAEAAGAEAAAAEPAVEQPPSLSSIVTPAAVATDAPTTTDVPEPPAIETKAPPAQPARAVAALSSSHDDLPELQPRRPRWLLPLGAAAAIGLGVVGLRQLDHAPTPVPAELAKPVNAAKAPVAAPKPKSDDGDDDDGDLEPNTGTDSAPGPIPTEPDPLGAKTKSDDAKAKSDAKLAGEAPAAAAPPASDAPAPIPADGTAPVAATGTIRINVDSDPPGARMFWKGKEVGTTPFVLEFQAGERHAYEMGLPGYTTRKVVIDGSKTDISIGLRPAPTATGGGTPRK